MRTDCELPEEVVQPTQLPAETTEDQTAQVVELDTATETNVATEPASITPAVALQPAPKQYDLIYKWNAPVRTKAEPVEQDSEIAPVLETDVVENLS